MLGQSSKMAGKMDLGSIAIIVEKVASSLSG